LTEALHLIQTMRPPKIRRFREFVEQEIVIPSGEFAGQRYRISRQPFSGLLFDAYDSTEYNMFVATGMRQSGKTLNTSTIPAIYHLFELGENVIYGIPDMEMVGDKWREDLMPAIMATRYRDLLPKKGGGSKGGRVRSIKFRNGATLRFMTAGGSDKSRVGFTSRVVIITETDGWAKSSETSVEADKITQILHCTDSYGDRRRIYMECTVTVKEGRTWKEIKAGTDSRIAIECPHCLEHVSPEREHLIGWQEAEDPISASEKSAFVCPACGAIWSEEDRIAANRKAVRVDRGQTAEKGGIVTGDPPRTRTLGFRWNPTNNILRHVGEFGQAEWNGSHNADEDNAERELCQFLWAIPFESKGLDISVIDEKTAGKRLVATPKGVIPIGTEWVTSFCDVGKWKLWWITVAWTKDFRGTIIDYDHITVTSDTTEEEIAIAHGLAEYHEIVSTGWIREKFNDMLIPHQAWVDCRYKPQVVHKFCREANVKGGSQRFRPCEGFGTAMSEARKRAYLRPKAVTKTTVYIGDEFHIDWEQAARLFVVKLNADHWKARAIGGFAVPQDQPGAITFYRGGKNEHRTAIRHFAAEHQEMVFVPGKGMMKTFKVVRRENHLLDGLSGCTAAASLCGARLILAETAPRQEVKPRTRLTTPDGRPFLVSERETR
jgi:phage terminase large subunit GpA-like protein